MSRIPGMLVLLGVVAGLIGGCGATPTPTRPPPTQTPWIIVFTPTPQVLPTQTPWILVATPTRTRTAPPTPTVPGATGVVPTATVAPTATPVPPTSTPAPRPLPTSTPGAEALKYPAPMLLDPPPYRPVGWKDTVLLQWTSVGTLAEDEYYHLHMERPPAVAGQEWYGDYVYTQDTQYLAEGAFLAPFHPPAAYGRAVVYWWVRVVRKTGEDQNGKPIGVDISLPSEKWTLVLEPKPEDK